MAEDLRARCCIVGCGPAGAMLGLLLARQGVEVVVLEKHGDFLRDFRGDDMAPSTLEILDELGLATGFLELGPKRMPVVEAHLQGQRLLLADLRRVRTRFPFMAVIPQWDFLDFVTGEAARSPTFKLLMNAEVTEVLFEDGAARGVRYRSGGASGTVRAPLTVAADGRHSTVRQQAGLELVRTAPPIDLLWFKLPRDPRGPEDTSIAIFMAEGRAVGRMNRGDYWQVACVIPKDSAPAVRAAGIDAFAASIRRIVPDLDGAAGALRDWDQVSLLSVQTNRLRRWYREGLLCIGDAAHAMSPIGGVGINFAIQDAVAAANHVAAPLRAGRLAAGHLAAVQRQRGWQVRIMQALVGRMTGGVLLTLEPEPRGGAALAQRLAGPLLGLPGFCAVRSRIVGIGFRRVHVATPAP